MKIFYSSALDRKRYVPEFQWFSRGSNVRRGVLNSTLLLIVCLFSVTGFCWQTAAQIEHTIETRGHTWPKYSIQICIISHENQSWWEPQYLDSALNGIAMWNDALTDFSLTYPKFGYLSRLSFVPTIETKPVSGFDIYMGWVAECELESTIGQTSVLVNSQCNIINSTVCLAAKAPSGHIMTEVDMQNIIVHELGHNFGLSHSSHSEDVMYNVVQYRETVKQLSTLDLYAVSQNFFWINNSTQLPSANPCPEASVLSLPSNIPYSFFPIGSDNIPEHNPQNFIEKATEFILHPEILILLLVGAILLLFVTIMRIRRQKNS